MAPTLVAGASPYAAAVAADRELIDAVKKALRRVAQPELAPAMQAYMKSAMPYLGVRVPVMRSATRAEAKSRPFSTPADVSDTVVSLWHTAGYREERYAALALLDTPTARKLREPGLLPVLTELISTGAWWDYVDETSHRVGELLVGWPGPVRPEVEAWATGPDIWLRRASIICQIGLQDRVDTGLLTFAIEASVTEKEFFLRKGIGWALRDYAYTAPEWVRDFAASHELSPLSRREALKHIG
jgi:3-methyladenine DNA glycosylase AlkD